MKKYLFIALAAAGMLSSCSSDDTVANERVNSEDLVPIKIGMGNIATNVTRGTGTIGANGADITDTWAGELVKIYMFEQGTLNLAQNQGDAIYEDAEFQTPAGKVGDEADVFATPTDGVVKFYPASGKFSFFGYRTDGAQGTAVPAKNTANDTLSVAIAIDGSQDVMGAKCDSAAVATTLGSENFFSAYSARHDVDPELTFKHLLSRLTFQVKAGNNNADGVVDPALATATPGVDYAVQITAIRVKSKTTGNFAIASIKDAFEPSIAWDATAAYTALELKENKTVDANGDGNLDDLLVKSLKGTKNDAWVAADHAIGEALLVAPGDHTYTLQVAMKQVKHITDDPTAYNADPAHAADPVDANGNKIIEMDPYETNITIPGAVDAVAEAGSSYNVQIIVYGLEDIQVKTILTPWTLGGDIEIDPDANI